MSNFLHKVVRSWKYIFIAQDTAPPKVIQTIYTEPRIGTQLETSEKENQAHSIPGKETARRIPIANDVSAVHYKPT